MEPIDHPVSQYAVAVVEKREVAGELVTMACERHLRDLENGADRGLYFDCEAASAIGRFAKLLHHTKGPFAGKPLALEPWQMFRHGSVFGWKRRDTGKRRFKSTFHQVGKKNGKTTDTTVPMLFTQLLDGEGTPEAYCAALNSKQAGILFKEIKRTIKASPYVRPFFDILRHEVLLPAADGSITCLTRDSDSSDGINPSFLARDELHRWVDREFAETIVESMIARDQWIDWVITTAGQNRKSICGELRGYAESVIRGKVIDDDFFAYVAEPPIDCDPLDPRAWKMGNPNLGVSKSLEAMEKAAKKATNIQATMPNFRRFHLNLWTAGAQSWIGSEAWDTDAAAAPIDIAALRGLPAWAAIDLSETTDLTAICVAVPVGEIVYLIVYSFLPSGPKGFIVRAQTEKREYVGWRDMGWLEVHHGGTIDQGEIVDRLKWVREFFDLREVAFDPWRMQYLASELEQKGFPMVEHRQGYASMSNPMKRVEELVAQGRIRHGGNPVLEWAVTNVHRTKDAGGNVKPDKSKATGRIDPAVAMIMAVGRAAAGQGKRKSMGIVPL